MSVALPPTDLNFKIVYQYQFDPAGYVALLYLNNTMVKFLARTSSEDVTNLEGLAMNKLVDLFSDALRK